MDIGDGLLITYWNNKGNSLLNEGKYENAIKLFDRALKRNPSNAISWYNKGLALYNLGRQEEAVECYGRSLKIYPGDASTWNNKGSSLHILGRYEEAIECYDKAIKINPKEVRLCAMIWTNKAKSLTKLWKYKEAIHCCDNALKRDPQYDGALNTKSNCLECLRKSPSINEVVQKAMNETKKIINTDIRGIDSLSSKELRKKAIYLGAVGKYEESLRCSNKALEINPLDDGAWVNKGLALKGLGKFNDATKCFDKALEIDPDYELAKRSKEDCLKKLR